MGALLVPASGLRFFAAMLSSKSMLLQLCCSPFSFKTSQMALATQEVFWDEGPQSLSSPAWRLSSHHVPYSETTVLDMEFLDVGARIWDLAHVFLRALGESGLPDFGTPCGTRGCGAQKASWKSEQLERCGTGSDQLWITCSSPNEKWDTVR